LGKIGDDMPRACRGTLLVRVIKVYHPAVFDVGALLFKKILPFWVHR
jgi:hypothetical protein